MTHKVEWLKDKRVLLAEFFGHQNEDTLRACMDEMVAEFDTCDAPVAALIDWRGVTERDVKALLNMRGHRAYSHPIAARSVFVGMDGLAQFENEISAVKTRESKNTQYYDTMEEALAYLGEMFIDDPFQSN